MTPIGEAARRETLLERIVAEASSDRTVYDLCQRTGASPPYTRRTVKVCDLPWKRASHPKPPPHDSWPPSAETELCDLWALGLSISDIGKRMGKSRGAVVGKARRLGLAKRVAPANFRRQA